LVSEFYEDRGNRAGEVLFSAFEQRRPVVGLERFLLLEVAVDLGLVFAEIEDLHHATDVPAVKRLDPVAHRVRIAGVAQPEPC
jgi:hypothetical protein